MGAIGGARCQYHLRQILVFLDAMVMNKPEFMGGVIQNKVDPQSGEVVDQSTLDHLSGQLSAFAEYIQRVKRKSPASLPGFSLCTTCTTLSARR